MFCMTCSFFYFSFLFSTMNELAAFQRVLSYPPVSILLFFFYVNFLYSFFLFFFFSFLFSCHYEFMTGL